MLNFHLMRNETDCSDEDCCALLQGKFQCDLNHVQMKYAFLVNVFQKNQDLGIYVVDTPGIWKVFSKKFELPSWVCAFSFDNKVVIKTPDLWHVNNVGTFEETLVHEMVHCLVSVACGSMPLWLEEGLAIHLSEQDKYYETISTQGLDMNSLDYNAVSLYDLSISRLSEMLKTKDISLIIRDYILGGVESETKYSKSGGSGY